MTGHPLFRLPLGAHRNVANAIYHARALGIVSKGALDAVDRSPLHYKAWLEGPDEDTEALSFGRAFHCALLEPERFTATYAVEPDFGDCRKTENKAARNAWRDAHAGHEPLTDVADSAIRSMVAAVRSHELASLILRDGEPELTMTWKDSSTGLLCKTRPDYYVAKRRMCVDFKSCNDASEEAFAKDIARYRYHVQDALYRAGCHETGQTVEHFLFVAVEKTAPFAVGVHTLDADAVSRGHMRARSNIERIAECAKTGLFPGYPPHIHTISLPPWAA